MEDAEDRCVTGEQDLAAVIGREAVRCGIEIGQIVSSNGPSGAVISSFRGAIRVQIARSPSGFHIALDGHGHVWAEGLTAKVAEVVKVAAAWQRGMLVRNMSGDFPFMQPGWLALERESGTVVSAQWQAVLNDPELANARPLLELAFVDDRLRVLFPLVSHLTLIRFFRDPSDRTLGEVRVLLREDGCFEVGVADGVPGIVVGSAEEAVQRAALMV